MKIRFRIVRGPLRGDPLAPAGRKVFGAMIALWDAFEVYVLRVSLYAARQNGSRFSRIFTLSEKGELTVMTRYWCNSYAKEKDMPLRILGTDLFQVF